MTQSIKAHDRFFSKIGNMWEVLNVEDSWAVVVRQSYYWEGEWFFPENETPARFDVCALQSMQKVDALGFYC
jgi:hypothetical protein